MEAGRVPDGTGLSQVEPASAVSPAVAASIPRAGEWIVYHAWARSVAVGQVSKVTPKLVKIAQSWRDRQIRRDQIIATFGDKERAEHLKQAIDGVNGEFSRKRAAADNDRNNRVRVAQDAADKKIAQLVAKAKARSAMEVHHG